MTLLLWNGTVPFTLIGYWSFYSDLVFEPLLLTLYFGIIYLIWYLSFLLDTELDHFILDILQQF